MWGLLINLTLVALVLFVGGCSGRQDACLELSGSSSKEVLASLPVEPGVLISLEFINSIYLAPVRETLVYEPKEGVSVIMVESPSAGVFEYYGLEPDGTGKATLRRRIGDIRILSHDYTNHRLTVNGTTVELKGLVPDGEPITVKIRQDADCRR